MRSSLPLPMDERRLNRTVQPTDPNSTFPRILNRDLRPFFQYACGFFYGRPTSNFTISVIPYVLDTYCQFIAPVDAVFSWNGRGLGIPARDIGEIIAVILSQNGTNQGYFRD
jgi:hypothetical protein